MICATRSRPYLLLDVVDHLVAAVLAEVDIEVRHRHAFGIEEALEQQAEADRVEIGDGERIGDQRTSAGAAARPDRDALRLRPLDEVGDDQEVAGIFHPLDDAQLELEPLAVFLGGAPGREPVRGDAALEALDRLLAQLRALVDRCVVVADREARQDRRQRARPVGAALRDLDGGRDRFRQVGKHLRHLGAALEAMLGGELTPIGIGDQPALGDRDQRVVRLVVLAGREIRLVGGDQRNALGVGQLDEHRLRRPLALFAMALQLDVEAVAEQLGAAHRSAPPPACCCRRRWRHRADRPALRSARSGPRPRPRASRA